VVRIVANPTGAKTAAGQLIETRLVTHQTGTEGVPVSKVLVEEASDVARELYFSILVDERNRLLVQGITGSESSFHAQRCIEYNTKIVAGVTPGKGGTKHLGVAVFTTVEKAMAETGAAVVLIGEIGGTME
jgi:succinyl-CoA synthetase alpha subunit